LAFELRKAAPNSGKEATMTKWLKTIRNRSKALAGTIKMALQVILSAFFCVVFLTIVWGVSTIAMGNEAERSSKSRKIGGLCEYKPYPGKARIVSIHKKEMPENYSGPSYESYEVKFTFCSEEQIRETHGRVEGKEFSLRLTNSWYPGPKFLKKYAIEEGKRFDCCLNVITKGACTPTIFDFPTIDLGDYFEDKN
jgi:hypothetical protein